jgi:tetratricopeptide (TPR) repeat protein
MLNCLKGYSILLLLFSLSIAGVYGQKTEVYRSEELQYDKALELFFHDHYEPARKLFKRYLKENGDPNSELYVNASYYQALSSMKLFHKDSEYLMEHFLLDYPESNWKQPATIDLAMYNFNRRDYDDAVRWFNQIDKSRLSFEDESEITFKQGFSAFELEDYEEAKKSFFDVKDRDGQFAAAASYYYGHIAYTEANYQTALEAFKAAESDENFAKVVPYYISQIYHYQEKYDELIEYASPLVDDENTVRKEEMALLVGNAYYRKESYQEAIPFLETYMASNFNPAPQDAYRLAYAYYRNGQYSEAIDYFAKASKSDDEALVQVATYQMAHAYVRLDEKTFAQNAFKVAAQYTNDTEITEDALFNYAKLAYELSYDPFHEAIKAFDNYLKQYPSSTRKDEAYEFLLKVHLATKNYSAALDALDQLKTKDPLQQNLYQDCAYNLGVELMGKKKYAESLEMMSKAVSNGNGSKTRALAQYERGNIHYKMGDLEKAVKSYQEFLSNSAAYQTDHYNTANYNIGYCYFKMGDYDKSLTAFRSFLSGSKIDERRKTDALLREGDLYLVKKAYDSAIESYDKALKLEGVNGDYALYQMAQARGYQEKYREKISLLKKLFDEFPSTTLAAAANFEMGESYFNENDLDNGLFSFNRVIDEHPQSPYKKKSLLKRGLILYRQGKYDDAIASFKQVVEDYGVDAESNEAIATLKNIYIDLGKVDEYGKWLAEIPDYEVSPTELDSLTYQSAEAVLSNGNCDAAISSFEDYLRKYPNGLFVTPANYYIGECAYRANNYSKALAAHEAVISKPVSQFTESALLSAATIRFNQKDYQKALDHYLKLEEVASFNTNLLEAQIGIMRSAYELGNYDLVLEKAPEVSGADEVPQNIRAEAELLEARIQYQLKNYEKARPLFEKLSQNQNSESGAESKYRLAEMEFLTGQLDASEKQIFQLVQGFASYDFWKVKAFLLLSDIYKERKDFFQARATLQSIIDNVDDPNLVAEAREKMSNLALAEERLLQEGDTIPSPDSLDFEEDYNELIDEPNPDKK